MTTLLGPLPCRCGAIVRVVRRPVVITGHATGCGRHHPPCVFSESEELHEVVSLDASSERHRCAERAAA